MKKSFYSHGKLLLTAEYLVLDGACALAIPTKKGQWLLIEENDSSQMLWKSFDEEGNCWFETILTIEDNAFKQTQDTTEESNIATTLIDILNVAKELNPNFLSSGKGYRIESRLEFHKEWGLGSSSTLINNIAQWAKVNAFTLLEKSFGGSGYDIACAQHDSPILYKRNEGNPTVKAANFDPSFKENIFFIYLNQKQDSKASIKHYQALPLKDFDNAEVAINEITSKILNCSTIDEFNTLLDLHEEIISKIIKTPTVKSTLFSDYPGSIKSLGGWGGDFILVTGNSSEMEYFKKKGYHTILPYAEMIL
ncbi:mevalonate kinase [Aquimarina sp. EL_43]|uniref:GYDIA family GHMP kinase n=1 Tax=unclassified Aquimarina TaxID=2627091 RepID=UPI0018CB2FED|nr:MULTISPECIES: GYDIA family GHMP kinase [unclassified Aquimarina]MBG6133633.1 mevalonate kinase [Aquimarina sp. EL_35]MBG6152402.1 mevalonate kinase [Aquimarina sp. EL_32]MBG6172006.1 mevalonate kinase [Aquimarina sp. EL_43]